MFTVAESIPQVSWMMTSHWDASGDIFTVAGGQTMLYSNKFTETQMAINLRKSDLVFNLTLTAIRSYKFYRI